MAIAILKQRSEENKSILRDSFKKECPSSYKEIIEKIIPVISTDTYGEHALDQSRIHEIDDGNYQGTLVYIIASKGYQPSVYYAVYVNYGSCAGCDTLQSIVTYSPLIDKEIDEETLDSLMSLAEQIVCDIFEMVYP